LVELGIEQLMVEEATIAAASNLFDFGKASLISRAMDLSDFREYCLTKPNASESTPFGPDALVFKAGGKIFAIASLDEMPPRVSLKCDPERALDLRDRYEEVRPGYHLNKKHWNTIELSERIPPNELREWIDHSYELVCGSLSRRKRRPRT
jgi:predicted DNA-binding protein (MmcQ/YjbR family)